MINGIDYLRKMYPGRNEKDYQPNGLDLRLGAVYSLDATEMCGIFDGEKRNASLIEIPMGYNRSYPNGWVFAPHKPYIVEVQEQISIGDNNAQLYLPRSTLLRNGVTVETAVGDLGYNGKLQFLLVNHRNNGYYLEKGERFVQLVDFDVKGGSESYDGDYQEPEWDIDNRIQF